MQARPMREVRPGLIALMLALLTTAAPLAAQEPAHVDGKPADAHGAAAMEFQIQRLERLVPANAWKQAPRGVDAVIWWASIPKDNTPTQARIDLGRTLYFDKRLSADDSVSCATCHDVTRGFTDQRKVSEGIHDQLGRRNAPTTLNAALIFPQFLDGREPDLEAQAVQPILNPVEMGMPDEATVVGKIAAIPEYQKAFQEAYGRPVNYQDIGRAIAAFERTLMFLEAPFDRFLTGEQEAISAEARAGFELFNGKARCVSCHPINGSNPLGTDLKFHNIGVSARHHDFEALAKEALAALKSDDSERNLDRLAVGTDLSELGRFMITRNYSDIGAFRTTQLRNIGITGPYMHDGTLVTLWDVLDHYNKGGESNPYLDGGIEALALSEEEIGQVVAFLFTLTDHRFAKENARAMATQKEHAMKERPFRDTKLADREVLGFEERVRGGQEQDR